MNRQGNVYTIIYSAVLVLVVGAALALVYQALRPRQVENITNDTKRQILAAARIVPTKGQDVAELYAAHIKRSFIVNVKGEEVDPSKDAFDVKVASEIKKTDADRLLPVFECTTAQGTKYILPIYGAGLWGPIWGYVAFDSNGDTIYGAYFAHQGETPGLGAEIEKPAFRNQFDGKNVFSPEGDFTSVAVAKAGQEPTDRAWVHAISGGTITSQGVQKMLMNCLAPYAEFLKSLKGKSQGNA